MLSHRYSPGVLRFYLLGPDRRMRGSQKGAPIVQPFAGRALSAGVSRIGTRLMRVALVFSLLASACSSAPPVDPPDPWEGWVYLEGLGIDGYVRVPGPSADLPSFSWAPCSTGDCEELVAPTGHEFVPPLGLDVTLDVTSSETLLGVVTSPTEGTAECTGWVVALDGTVRAAASWGAECGLVTVVSIHQDRWAFTLGTYFLGETAPSQAVGGAVAETPRALGVPLLTSHSYLQTFELGMRLNWVAGRDWLAARRYREPCGVACEDLVVFPWDGQDPLLVTNETLDPEGATTDGLSVIVHDDAVFFETLGVAAPSRGLNVWTQAGGAQFLVRDPSAPENLVTQLATDGVQMAWVTEDGMTSPAGQSALFAADPASLAPAAIPAWPGPDLQIPIRVGCGLVASGVGVARISDGVGVWQAPPSSEVYGVTCDHAYLKGAPGVVRFPLEP